MKKKIIIIILLIVIICISLFCYFLFKRSQTIKIDAASAFYPFTTNLMENYKDKTKIKLVSTSEAFNNLIKGKTDIIIATKPSDDQKELIENSNISLEYIKLYLEPLVIYVNKDNSINNLTIEDIKSIYYSDKDNWNSYQLQKNNGSQTCFESIVKNNKINNRHIEIKTMPEIIDRVGEDKNGIGYAFNSYYSKMHINKNTKIINVDDKNISDKDYPLLFEVYLIFRADTKNNKVINLINWLNTPKGKNTISTSIE